METSNKTAHTTDNTAEIDMLKAREPLEIERDERRRFVRLEISTPMSLQTIKDSEGHYWPEGDWHIKNGTILNLSASGVLVDLDQTLEEGDVVAMNFTFQDVEGISNVLGLVKRADLEADGCLVGIEFISVEYLLDHFTQAEIDLLADNYTNFDNSIRQLLNRYIYRDARLGA
jgi:hypothetical protein